MPVRSMDRTLTRRLARWVCALRKHLRKHLAGLTTPPAEFGAIAERKFFESHRDRHARPIQLVSHAVGEIWERHRLATARLEFGAQLRVLIQLELPLLAPVRVAHRVQDRL